jgi:SPP1 gp7 family putative phage head morphogenesis protein
MVKELERRFRRLRLEVIDKIWKQNALGLVTANIIRKHGTKWRLHSKTGKNLGTFDSREGAERHEREVEYFKRQAANEAWDIVDGEWQTHYELVGLSGDIYNAFCATGSGGGVDPSCPGGQGGGAGPIESKLGSIYEAAKALPGNIVSKIKDKVKKNYDRLSARYGSGWAKAIIAAAIIGTPIPAPGSTFAVAAPIVGLAELHRMLTKKKPALATANEDNGNDWQLSDQQVQALAQWFTKSLATQFKTDPDFRGMAQEPTPAPTGNAGDWEFRSDPEKLEAFKQWLKGKTKQHITKENEDKLWEAYARAGFKKGAGRSFDDYRAKKKLLDKEATPEEKLAFYRGSREQFLKSSFAQPVAIDKIKLIAARSYSDLEGVTEAMSTAMTRTLADGLVEGKSPREIASDLADDVEDIGESRAKTIARTEIIRAHAEGQLDALERLGVEEVGVMVEWSTTGDDKVCDLCEPLEGIVIKIDEARGMLPRHPNCRCAFIPANVGEDDEDQKRTKGEIGTAIRASLKEDTEESDWGPGETISQKRPPSILNEVVTGLDGSSLNHFLDSAVTREVVHRLRMDLGLAESGVLVGNNPQTIYVVRHGKTKYNAPAGSKKHDRIRGWQDIPLDAEGHKQAEVAGQWFKDNDIKLKAVHSSNLSRTEETAKQVAKATDNKVELDQALRPWHLGKFQGMESNKVHPHMVDYATKNPDKKVPEGESFNEFASRYIGALNKVLKAGGDTAIVTHFRNLKLTQAWVAAGCRMKGNLPVLDMKVFFTDDLDTGAVLKLEHHKGACKIKEVVDPAKSTRNAFCPTGPGGGVDPSCSPGTAAGAKPIGGLDKALKNVLDHTGFTQAQLKTKLRADMTMRARVTGSLLISGKGVPNAVTHLKDIGDEARVKAITEGNNSQALIQYKDTPAHDLAAVTKITQKSHPVSGEAVANLNQRTIKAGTTTRPGSYRHELGHVLRAAMSGKPGEPGNKNTTTKAIHKEFEKVQERVKADPSGLKKKMPHEWYEEHYGVAGRRSLDNWEENAAEHYRLYHRELYRDKHEGGGGKFLDGYRQRHPGWAKIWDAHYTAALIHEHLNG